MAKKKATKKVAKSAKKPLIGFIGQGWIGKNYATDFEKRGYTTVRFALEEPYRKNRDKIKDCEIVIIAVPTPTTPKGFDASIVEEALGLVGKGKIAVVKSTILPGTTKRFQEKFPNIVVVYSPEFLSETTAAHDAAHPFSNIVGLPVNDAAHKKAAQAILKVLPKAPFSTVCSSTEAEIIKYTHNASGYVQIILFNMVYDLSQKLGTDWSAIHKAILADPMICNRYSQPVHKSGRGAGGGCFIKDFAALRELYEKNFPNDTQSSRAFRAFECKNIDLLMKSKKDLGLLKGVYGENPGDLCENS